MRESSQIQIRLGTSAFAAAGWPGTSYPAGMKSTDYLSYYSAKFDTVEVDSTFYRIPKEIQAWLKKNAVSVDDLGAEEQRDG